MCNCLCSVIVLCGMKGREKVKINVGFFYKQDGNILKGSGTELLYNVCGQKR